jgi:hypothetical protein
MKAQAGPLLPGTPLSSLIGSSATVGDLEFSNFGYSVNPSGSPPSAADVSVSPFTTIPGETGITFNGAFTAPPGKTVDYAITYKVTTTDGTVINDAFLSQGGFVTTGGGSAFIGETIFDATTGKLLSKSPFQVFSPGQAVDTTSLVPPSSSILVDKDITVVGGSTGSTTFFSFANQGFSTVPEPVSMALMGIGLTGLFTFRRFLKRVLVA